jgi:hypothetical protein
MTDPVEALALAIVDEEQETNGGNALDENEEQRQEHIEQVVEVEQLSPLISTPKYAQ